MPVYGDDRDHCHIDLDVLLILEDKVTHVVEVREGISHSIEIENEDAEKHHQGIVTDGEYDAPDKMPDNDWQKSVPHQRELLAPVEYEVHHDHCSHGTGCLLCLQAEIVQTDTGPLTIRELGEHIHGPEESNRQDPERDLESPLAPAPASG